MFIHAIKHTFHSIIEFAGELSKKKISVYASSTAYFLFSSIPPFIILMSMLLPRFGLSIGELVKMVTDITPDDLDYQVTLIIQDAFARSGSVVPIMIVFMLWTAANSIAALSEGLRMAYGVRKQQRYLAFRLLSILYTFSVILLLTAYMLISVFGEKIMGIIGWNRLKLPGFLMMVLNWHNLFFLLVGFTTVLFMYVFLSGRKLSIRYHVFGTIFTVIAWELFSVIFSAYLKFSTNRSVIYGSFSALVALLLWIYMAICILLAGGVLNKHIHREDDMEEARLRRERKLARRERQVSDGTYEQQSLASDGAHGQRNLDLDGTYGQRDPASDRTNRRRSPALDGINGQRNPNSDRTYGRRYLASDRNNGQRSQALDEAYESRAYDVQPLPSHDKVSGTHRLKNTATSVLNRIVGIIKVCAAALASFWTLTIVAGWNRFIEKVWNDPAHKSRRAAIGQFLNEVIVKRWNEVVVKGWNDVVVGKIIVPLSNRIGHLMEHFKHNDNDEL